MILEKLIVYLCFFCLLKVFFSTVNMPNTCMPYLPVQVSNELMFSFTTCWQVMHDYIVLVFLLKILKTEILVFFSLFLLFVFRNGLNFFFKLLAWVYTGSASMFSEAIHSLADTCNQVSIFPCFLG